MAQWLVRWTPDRGVRIRAPDGAMRLFLARHFPLTVPLFTQVYKWVTENFLLGVTLR